MVADEEDASVVPKDGMIRVINKSDQDKVICELATKKTKKQEIEIDQ